MRVFGVFAKFWEAGRVKTRLARKIGEERAARLYREFLTMSHRLGNQVTAERVVGFTPEERHQEFQDLFEDWKVVPQSDKDLGGRMSDFFRDFLIQTNEKKVSNEGGAGAATAPSSSDINHVVLIGSDTPSLPVSRINEAFEKLDTVDVVLGPSLDGGYYLIGCRTHLPELFVGVEWSSEKVMQQTRDRLLELGVPYCELESFTDIDEFEDLLDLKSSFERRVDDLNRDELHLLESINEAIAGA